MRFVTRRPRYTAGSPVPGFPPIRAVLYTDAECEVYLLDAAGAGSLLLVGARRHDGARAPSPEQLRGWLERHGCEFLGSPALSPDVHDVVVRVYGTWMAEIPTLPLTEHELYALLIALIDLATDAAHAGLTAVPIRPLLWMEGPLNVRRLSSVYVRAGDADREADVVRQIGQTFLWSATGISSIEMEHAPEHERLRAWCQNADAGLSQIVSRCLGSPQPITTLYELRGEVASSLLHLAETRPSVEQTANHYISLSPYRYLWIRRSAGSPLTAGRN